MVNIVVAKYKENIDWTKKIKNHKITIYDKSDQQTEGSIKLKNKGREGETFLYHIVNNYHNLDDVTVFLQGNPFEHLQILVGWRAQLTDDEINTVIRKMDNEINDQCDFTTFYQVIYNDPNHTNGVNSKYYCEKYYGESYNSFTVSPGAQYIVPKKYILSRPLDFWKKLQQAMFSEELNGYAQEQLWFLAFTHNMDYTFGNHDLEKSKCLKRYSMDHTPYSYFLDR
jgi:hypothetical protein